ncbi:MAG: flavodoxin family protein [Propionicimonas sp.]
MSVLIVVESQFGNTVRIARSIAAGLADTGATVSVQRCSEASVSIPDDVTLLLLGAPTHNLHLSNPASRKQALERGASEGEGPGLCDWIGRVEPRPELRVVTFDTVMGKFSGSAAKAALKLLRKRGFRRSEQGRSFIVDAAPGPPHAGEEDRAASWATELVA